MSRSGYSDDGDYDPLAEGRWIARRNATFKGKRGQAFLRELLQTLEAMPEKRLITGDLETQEGTVCAIGAVGKARGVDMITLDPNDHNNVASAFGISATMAREIVFANDDDFNYTDETPERRYARMLDWVRSEISA